MLECCAPGGWAQTVLQNCCQNANLTHVWTAQVRHDLQTLEISCIVLAGEMHVAAPPLLFSSHQSRHHVQRSPRRVSRILQADAHCICHNVQVEAGLWKRNGHSSQSAAMMYLTGPWAEFGLELDVVLMQSLLAKDPDPEQCVPGF